MPEQAKQNRLGRGLSALLDETDMDQSEGSAERGHPRELPIEFLQPNPHQPRKVFEEQILRELTDSIRERGIVQPIVVRPVPNERDAYQIVAGERRWRAAQRAAIHSVPVVIRDLTDAEALELSIIENVQRSDLGALEEAMGYHALIEEFGHTQEQLARVIGKSRSHVANTLRLLSLPQRIQDLISNGDLTAGHGRALLTAAEPNDLASQIIKKKLNVRQAEALARGKSAKKPTASWRLLNKDADTLALEQDVSNALGLKVSIDYDGEKGGGVQIYYKTLEQLDEICRRLGREV